LHYKGPWSLDGGLAKDVFLEPTLVSVSRGGEICVLSWLRNVSSWTRG